MAESHASEGGTGGQPGARQFSDADGRRWTVTEEPTPESEWTSADEETGRSGYPVGWLTFAHGALRKRLRLFPKQWRSLTDTELERLCRRARATRTHD